MDEAIENAGITYTDDQINQLAQRHFENTQVGEDLLPISPTSVCWHLSLGPIPLHVLCTYCNMFPFVECVFCSHLLDYLIEQFTFSLICLVFCFLEGNIIMSVGILLRIHQIVFLVTYNFLKNYF